LIRYRQQALDARRSGFAISAPLPAMRWSPLLAAAVLLPALYIAGTRPLVERGLSATFRLESDLAVPEGVRNAQWLPAMIAGRSEPCGPPLRLPPGFARENLVSSVDALIRPVGGRHRPYRATVRRRPDGWFLVPRSPCPLPLARIRVAFALERKSAGELVVEALSRKRPI
jgi:hypothetical protein